MVTLRKKRRLMQPDFVVPVWGDWQRFVRLGQVDRLQASVDWVNEFARQNSVPFVVHPGDWIARNPGVHETLAQWLLVSPVIESIRPPLYTCPGNWDYPTEGTGGDGVTLNRDGTMYGTYVRDARSQRWPCNTFGAVEDEDPSGALSGPADSFENGYALINWNNTRMLLCWLEFACAERKWAAATRVIKSHGDRLPILLRHDYFDVTGGMAVYSPALLAEDNWQSGANRFGGSPEPGSIMEARDGYRRYLSTITRDMIILCGHAHEGNPQGYLGPHIHADGVQRPRNVVTNGDFSAGAANWLTTNWTIEGGMARVTVPADANELVHNVLIIFGGSRYTIRLTISGATTGYLRVLLGETAPDTVDFHGNGTFTRAALGAYGNYVNPINYQLGAVYLYGQSGWDGQVTDIRIEPEGQHGAAGAHHHALRVNYQTSPPSNRDAAVRLLHFIPSLDRVEVTTYDPWNQRYHTGPWEAFDFELRMRRYAMN